MNETITLVALSFTRVELRVTTDAGDRHVSVLVGSHKTWAQAVRFPHWQDESGLSTGDPILDDEVRERAAEELIRLACAVECVRERRAAA